MKTKIFLSGATGTMGTEALKLFLENNDRFQVKILVLPAEKKSKLIRKYKECNNLEIIYGDITNYDNVFECVTGSDYILHCAALIPPMADRYPELTEKINYGGTLNIIEAIKNQPNPDEMKLVYIGSVAETGDRPIPYHWGRVGDPIMPSVFDYYAVTKAKAERAVIESDLKYWVSLRQTAILHSGLLKIKDGIMFHQPLNTHIEWITSKDAGRVLYKLCDSNLTDDFWNNIYNIGGGAQCRNIFYDYIGEIYSLLGIKDFKDITERNWFATRNFHCQWYTDSNKLENILHFRSESVKDFNDSLKSNIPAVYKLAKFLPKTLFKNLVMKSLTNHINSPYRWVKEGLEGRINAFFGSKEKWKNIKSWNDFSLNRNESITYLDHGYDDNIPDNQLSLEEIQSAALFRGGRCLSSGMEKGDLKTKLNWQCSQGHTFQASPFLILKGGHWCPECAPTPWNYDKLAKSDKFLAQIYYVNHDSEEANFYNEDCCLDIANK